MSFSSYLSRIENELVLAVEQMGEKTVLRDAIGYALGMGGKRVRPLIVLGVAEALGGRFDVMEAALSVEYFHTASLIADDLPCMDNDDLRRNRPSLHKAFGEDVALLASYTLIAAGYGGICENGKKMGSDTKACQAVSLALEIATRCAGLQGATQGQYYDLYPPNSSWETVQKIMYLKTVTLFEIAFAFGWLFGGGRLDALAELKTCAYHLGMAFQVSDDLQDKEVLDQKEATLFFDRSIDLLKQSLQKIGLWTSFFQTLYNFLEKRSRS